jgi:hypothetical protein
VDRVVPSQKSFHYPDPAVSTDEDALLIYTKLSEPNHDGSSNCHVCREHWDSQWAFGMYTVLLSEPRFA